MAQIVVTVARGNKGEIACDPKSIEVHRGDTVRWVSPSGHLVMTFKEGPFAGTNVFSAGKNQPIDGVVRADAPLNKLFKATIAVDDVQATVSQGDVIVREPA
jgi:plastocyanin